MMRRAVLAWGLLLGLAPRLGPAQPLRSPHTPPMHPNLLMPSATTPLTPPPEVQAFLPEAQRIGTGQLRFFGLLVYEARLWARPDFKAADYARQAFALELAYARKLDGPAIAERSIAEMLRIGSFTEAQQRQWLALMMQAFPSVVAQDRLVGTHDGQGGVRFFHNGRLTAEVVDRSYARLFFGIWLAEQTSAPALRQALIGPSA